LSRDDAGRVHDGLVHAGERKGQPMDICTSFEAMLEGQDPTPQAVADTLLAEGYPPR